MYRKLILILSPLLIYCSIHAQSDSITKNAYKLFAQSQIDSLKSHGCVILILRSNSRSIKAYENAGKTKLAEEMKKEVRITNKFLVRAFYKNWSFCPVYFILGDSLKSFLADNTARVFTDTTLRLDTNIQCIQKFRLFIEYGTLYEVQNKESDWQPSSFKSDVVGNIDPSNGTPVVEDALVVKDANLFQFRYPFPYFAQVKFGIKTVEQSVIRLCDRFWNFYNKSMVEK